MNYDKDFSQPMDEKQYTEYFLTEIKKYNELDEKIKKEVELTTKHCIYAIAIIMTFVFGAIGLSAGSSSDKDLEITPTILTILGTLAAGGFSVKLLINIIKCIAKEVLLVSQLEKFIEEMEKCESQMQPDYEVEQEEKGMNR